MKLYYLKKKKTINIQQSVVESNKSLQTASSISTEVSWRATKDHRPPNWHQRAWVGNIYIYIYIYDALMQSKPSCIERVWNFCFANCLSPIEELRTRWSQTGSHHTNAKAKTKFCDQMNIWKTNNLNSPNCLCNTHIA